MLGIEVAVEKVADVRLLPERPAGDRL